MNHTLAGFIFVFFRATGNQHKREKEHQMPFHGIPPWMVGFQVASQPYAGWLKKIHKIKFSKLFSTNLSIYF
jgi:hypothetical protein